MAAPYHSEVPDAAIRWSTVRTEHFAIHYMAEDRRGVPTHAQATARALATHADAVLKDAAEAVGCLLYTSPSPRDGLLSRMPSSA